MDFNTHFHYVEIFLPLVHGFIHSSKFHLDEKFHFLSPTQQNNENREFLR